MSLAAAARANNRSQLNTVTEIKYSSRNNTARDHSMIAIKGETPVHGPARSFGTVQDARVNTATVLTCVQAVEVGQAILAAAR
jgi:hypothetical protein